MKSEFVTKKVLAAEKMLAGIATLPNDFKDLAVQEQRNWVCKQIRSHYANVPKNVIALLVGSAINDDCNRASLAVPEWLDHEKFEHGQRFAVDHYTGVSLVEILSLFTLFSYEHGIKPLIATGKSSDPFASFKRCLSAGKSVRNWYSSNVWTEGKLDNPTLLEGFNQTEIANMQFGFMGLIILYPERFGIHGATNEDLEAFVHVWRGLGYLMGIEDEFNFCNGTLEEVKQRSRDYLEFCVKPNLRDITPEWEQMMRCVTEGTKNNVSKITYEHALLYLADMINIPMPPLQTSLSYSTWFRFYLMEFLFTVTARIPGTLAGTDRAVKQRI